MSGLQHPPPFQGTPTGMSTFSRDQVLYVLHSLTVAEPPILPDTAREIRGPSSTYIHRLASQSMFADADADADRDNSSSGGKKSFLAEIRATKRRQALCTRLSYLVADLLYLAQRTGLVGYSDTDKTGDDHEDVFGRQASWPPAITAATDLRQVNEWLVSNSIQDLDYEKMGTSAYAYYDGHGGGEEAAYMVDMVNKVQGLQIAHEQEQEQQQRHETQQPSSSPDHLSSSPTPCSRGVLFSPGKKRMQPRADIMTLARQLRDKSGGDVEAVRRMVSNPFSAVLSPSSSPADVTAAAVASAGFGSPPTPTLMHMPTPDTSTPPNNMAPGHNSMFTFIANNNRKEASSFSLSSSKRKRVEEERQQRRQHDLFCTSPSTSSDSCNNDTEADTLSWFPFGSFLSPSSKRRKQQEQRLKQQSNTPSPLRRGRFPLSSDPFTANPTTRPSAAGSSSDMQGAGAAATTSASSRLNSSSPLSFQSASNRPMPPTRTREQDMDEMRRLFELSMDPAHDKHVHNAAMAEYNLVKARITKGKYPS